MHLAARVCAQDTLYIGGLFPDITGGGARRERVEHFRLAIQMLNDKTDGWYDDIIPNTEILTQEHESGCDADTAASAIWKLYEWPPADLNYASDATSSCTLPLAMDTKMAVVGPACSGASLATSYLSSAVKLPQISYSATAASLSGRDPYFFRTVGPDSKRVERIHSALERFGWAKICIISTDTPYGLGVANSLSQGWVAAGKDVLGSHTVKKTEDSIDTEAAGAALDALDGEGCRVVAVCGHKEDAREILRIADSKEIGGEAVWIVADPVASPGGNVKTILAVLDRAPQSDLANKYRSEWARHVASNSAKGSNWSGDKDGQPNTIEEYGWYSHDAVVTIARAHHKLLTDRRTDCTSARWSTTQACTLQGAIKSINFEGVSGRVRFDDLQDRSDPEYSISLLGQNAASWTEVGVATAQKVELHGANTYLSEPCTKYLTGWVDCSVGQAILANWEGHFWDGTVKQIDDDTITVQWLDGDCANPPCSSTMPITEVQDTSGRQCRSAAGTDLEKCVVETTSLIRFPDGTTTVPEDHVEPPSYLWLLPVILGPVGLAFLLFCIYHNYKTISSRMKRQEAEAREADAQEAEADAKAREADAQHRARQSASSEAAALKQRDAMKAKLDEVADELASKMAGMYKVSTSAEYHSSLHHRNDTTKSRNKPALNSVMPFLTPGAALTKPEPYTRIRPNQTTIAQVMADLVGGERLEREWLERTPSAEATASLTRQRSGRSEEELESGGMPAVDHTAVTIKVPLKVEDIASAAEQTLPPLPEHIDFSAAGQSVLAVRQGQIIQVSTGAGEVDDGSGSASLDRSADLLSKSKTSEWLYGNVLYDPDETATGPTSGWFPKTFVKGPIQGLVSCHRIC
jgi:ABC-type branched-subunit amino acid transport system substrate-binding protein